MSRTDYSVDVRSDAEASALLQKCVKDPVTAQREAQRLYDGEVCWDDANWSNPLLKQLSQLSALSNHDMPQVAHLRRQVMRELPREHPAVRSGTSGLSEHADRVSFVPDLELKHADGCTKAAASEMAQVFGLPTSIDPKSPIATAKLTMPKTPSVAPPQTASTVAQLTQLLHLSSSTIASDPQLAELVRAVAERNQSTDPRAAQLLSNGATVTLPDETDRARLSAADRIRASATAHSVVSPNKAFHASDVVAYHELQERETAPTSMHDTPDYEPWFMRAIDVGAKDEPSDNYETYREELTTAVGRLLAVEQRTAERVEREKNQRLFLTDAPSPSKAAVQDS